MDEYINATTLLKEIDYAFHTDTIGKKDVINLIVNLPVADITPVRHGRWVKRGRRWQCTNCKVLMSIDGTPKENLLNYCPNCGAKMDEEWV